MKQRHLRIAITAFAAAAAALALPAAADEPMSRVESVIEKKLSPESLLSNFTEKDVGLLFDFFRAALRGDTAQAPAELQQRMEKVSKDLAGRMSEAALAGLDAAEADVKDLIRGRDGRRSPLDGMLAY